MSFPVTTGRNTADLINTGHSRSRRGRPPAARPSHIRLCPSDRHGGLRPRSPRCRRYRSWCAVRHAREHLPPLQASRHRHRRCTGSRSPVDPHDGQKRLGSAVRHRHYRPRHTTSAKVRFAGRGAFFCNLSAPSLSGLLRPRTLTPLAIRSCSMLLSASAPGARPRKSISRSALLWSGTRSVLSCTTHSGVSDSASRYPPRNLPSGRQLIRSPYHHAFALTALTTSVLPLAGRSPTRSKLPITSTLVQLTESATRTPVQSCAVR